MINLRYNNSTKQLLWDSEAIANNYMIAWRIDTEGSEWTEEVTGLVTSFSFSKPAGTYRAKGKTRTYPQQWLEYCDEIIVTVSY